jgi:DNA-binding NarL/FixJ family response regulator
MEKFIPETNAFSMHLENITSINCELTPQQEKICQLISLGMKVPEIAIKLYKSHRTIENHIQKIKAKTKIYSTTTIACWYTCWCVNKKIQK